MLKNTHASDVKERMSVTLKNVPVCYVEEHASDVKERACLWRQRWRTYLSVMLKKIHTSDVKERTCLWR